MKKLLLGAVLALLGGLQLQAGNVLVTNYNEDSGAQLPISLSSGAALLKGGSVQIGTWTADPTALIAGLTSPAGRDALLAAFVTFGATNAIGNDVDGLYQADKSQLKTYKKQLLIFIKLKSLICTQSDGLPTSQCRDRLRCT